MSRVAVHRWIAIASMSVALSGCYKWRTEPGPMPEAAVNATRDGNKVRVRLKDGGEAYFVNAGVVGDSLVGRSRGVPPKTGLVGLFCKKCATAVDVAYELRPLFTLSVPLSNVRAIAQYKGSVGEFLLALLVIVVVTVGLFILIGTSLQ